MTPERRAGLRKSAAWAEIIDALDEKDKEIELLSAPQRYYDAERNFTVGCFWDAGFDLRLGDTMNGFHAQFLVFSDGWKSVCEALVKALEEK